MYSNYSWMVLASRLLMIALLIIIAICRSSTLPLDSEETVHVNAAVGDRATLPCEAETREEVDWRFRNASHPNLEAVWNLNTIVNGYKERFTIETNAVGTYNLVIFPVQLKDSGIYNCVEGSFGKVHRVILTVYLKTKAIPAGEDVSLPCTVRDGVHAQWMRGEQELLPAADGILPFELRDRLSLRQRGRQLQELYLRKATVNDSNVYTCLDGSIRNVTNLRILGIANTTAITANIGETVRLDCGSSSWLFKPESYSESEELIVDGRRQTLELRMTAAGVEVRSVLTIHRLVSTDSGVYSCMRATYVHQYVLRVLVSSDAGGVNAYQIVAIIFAIISAIIGSLCFVIAAFMECNRYYGGRPFKDAAICAPIRNNKCLWRKSNRQNKAALSKSRQQSHAPNTVHQHAADKIGMQEIAPLRDNND